MQHSFNRGDLVYYEDEEELCMCMVAWSDPVLNNTVRLYRPGESIWYGIPKNLKLISAAVQE
jgi:hypothetical protein